MAVRQKGDRILRITRLKTGPRRNIPGSVVDHVIDTYPGKDAGGGKQVHYDPINNVTVVIGYGDSVVSVHKGPPRAGQY